MFLFYLFSQWLCLQKQLLFRFELWIDQNIYEAFARKTKTEKNSAPQNGECIKKVSFALKFDWFFYQ